MQRPTKAHLLYQPRPACPPVPSKARSWAQILGRYREPSHARSIIEIAITFGPLLALWALAWTALYLDYWWLFLLLAMRAKHKTRRRKGGTYPLSHLYGHFGLVRLCRLGHDVPWVKAWRLVREPGGGD